MEFRLIPKSKNVNPFMITSEDWNRILELSGSVLGVTVRQKGRYDVKRKGKMSPLENNGYEVTARQAALIASVIFFAITEYDYFPDNKSRIVDFTNFARISGGFELR